MRCKETLRADATLRKQPHQPAVDGLGGFAGQLLVHDRLDQRGERARQPLDPEPAGPDARDERGELRVGRGEVPLGELQVEGRLHGDG